MTKFGVIQLRDVEVHNLQHVDVDIPRRQLVVFCGVSGSGKTSLALDTLYAEGQRRYIESFSAYTRQFLERMDKPAAERIDGIPPSIAVTGKSPTKSTRATVGTATETSAYLRLLFAKIGKIKCFGCGDLIQHDSPESAAEKLSQLDDDLRFIICFRPEIEEGESLEEIRTNLIEDGFVRVLVDGKSGSLEETDATSLSAEDFFVVVDRLTGSSTITRISDSLETAFRHGGNRGHAFLFGENSDQLKAWPGNPDPCEIDGRAAKQVAFGSQLYCDACKIHYPSPEPRLFDFNSPLGACPNCEGFGNQVEVDMDLIVPNKNKTLEDGAIVPWNTPSYKHELQELLALARDYEIPTNIPFRELSDEHIRLIVEGVPERDFGGVNGFIEWLEERKYKMPIRVFLSRWKSSSTCSFCGGYRLRPESLAVELGGQNVAAISNMQIRDALHFFENIVLSDFQKAVSRNMLDQVRSRLQYLVDVGLSYLSLDRQLKTLSGGEAQRVSMTSALGSSLVNMLYVLDEPSVGLHPSDTDRLFQAVTALRDRGNSVVVVEHEESFLRSADHLIEIGPAAGERGGRVVYNGSAEGIVECDESITGDYLAGRRGIFTPERRRKPDHGKIQLRGASGNNLKNVDAEFPLGVLCLVTGVSGSGKSTLVQDTLYPALCIRKRKDAPQPLPYDEVLGDGQIDDVILVDQSPIGKSPRSNPVTYIKAFDAIRNVFAGTIEARTHNYTASHFSFNVDGGRCTACQGDGHVQIDMQFLADVYMKCSQCQGKRYRKEILDVTYRGKDISEVLQMSVRQAFAFFRGQQKVQIKLKQLIDVGLEYLRLGQPANTLSAGEAQRLKLATFLSSAKRKRTLFLLDEPTTGLHFSDIVKLLDCFQSLLEVGHSLIIVEHNLQLMKACDYIVDLGPGAADAGGEIVAHGSPEEIIENPISRTGKFLAEAIAIEKANALP